MHPFPLTDPLLKLVPFPFPVCLHSDEVYSIQHFVIKFVRVYFPTLKLSPDFPHPFFALTIPLTFSLSILFLNPSIPLPLSNLFLYPLSLPPLSPFSPSPLPLPSPSSLSLSLPFPSPLPSLSPPSPLSLSNFTLVWGQPLFRGPVIYL